MFDDLSVFYADFGTLVTREGGAFRGLLTVEDGQVFEYEQAGRVLLRYPSASATLVDGDALQIGGRSYRVVGTPRRQSAEGEERIAVVVEVG